MAIKKSLLLKSNLGDSTNVSCYIRVKSVNATKAAATCQYDIIRDGSDYVIESKQFYFNFDVSLNAPNAWTQSYVALKNLPEFVDAVDC